MTISNQTVQIREQGNGSKTDFDFPFPIALSSELKVWKITRATDAKTTSDPLVLGTDYTVTINTSTEGGTVTYTTAPASTEDSFITRELDYTQPTVFPRVNVFPEDTVEKTYDRNVKLIQQINRETNRALKLPDTTEVSDVLTDEPTDATVPRWSSADSQYKHVAIAASGSYVDPVTTEGDTIQGSSSGVQERHPIGPANTIRISNGTRLVYGKIGIDNIQTGVITLGNLDIPAFHNALPPDFVVKYVTDDTIDIDWVKPGLVLQDTSQQLFYVPKGNYTCDITTTGANGLDAGSATNTGYYVYIIANSTALSTGTTDSTTASKLEDSSADFVTDGVKVGDRVRNVTDNTETYVTAVDDLNTLSVNDDIFISGEDYEVYAVASLLAASSTSPTMPSGYDMKRIVGWVSRISGALVPFYQHRYHWKHTQHGDSYNVVAGDTSLSTTAETMNFGTGPTAPAEANPINIRVRYRVNHNAANIFFGIEVFHSDETSGDSVIEVVSQVTGISVYDVNNTWITQDTSQQAKYRRGTATSPATSEDLQISVMGFVLNI